MYLNYNTYLFIQIKKNWQLEVKEYCDEIFQKQSAFLQKALQRMIYLSYLKTW